jgi:hypothetical protein
MAKLYSKYLSNRRKQATFIGRTAQKAENNKMEI